MNKSELITHIGRKFHDLSERAVALCVNKIIDKMSDHLAKGGRIEVRDFGSFSLHFHDERLAHNPKTGERIITKPKSVVHFKPGKGMKDRINERAADTPIQESKDDDNE